MSAPDVSFRDTFPFKGFTASAVPTRFVDRLSDEELIELNRLLHWNSFTADSNGRRFGNAPRAGKRDHPQPIPDRRIERMDEYLHLADKHVLEIGCFEGIHTVALCLRSKQVTAVDARIENVVKTIVRCAMFGHSPLVFRCNVEEPSASDDLPSVDVVHHVGVLYHLRDPVRHLIELSKKTQHGIMLDTHYATDQKATEEYEVGGRRYRYCNYRESGYEDVFSGMYEQSRWLTLGGITDLLKHLGFESVEVVETHASRNGPRALVMARRRTPMPMPMPGPAPKPEPEARPPAGPSRGALGRFKALLSRFRGEKPKGLRALATQLVAPQAAAVQADLDKTIKVIKALTKRHYDNLPLPPEELRMHVGKTTSAANYWSQGMNSSTRALEIFGTAPQKPILDWGCGSGRTLRWLVCHEEWRHHYHGCDVDRAAIDWLRSVCRLNLEVCKDDPPLPYGDGFFGGLYAFSVLTHIHPDRHRLWYSELRRVLEPGGIAYLTTLGGSTITESRKGVHGPIDEAFAKDGFVYLKNEGHYKDAAIVSEEFTRRMLDGLFTIEDYVERGYQNMDAFRIRRLD
jgi:tRNA (mo5U34)-methyltransferase